MVIIKDMTTPNAHGLHQAEIVILAPDIGVDQCVERRDCRISNWPNCRITK